MFEAFNKSQPKLVYTYAGHHTPTRDKDETQSPSSRTVVSATSKDIDKKPETVKEHEASEHKFQQNQTLTNILQIQQPRIQQKYLQHAKEEMDRREIFKPHNQTKQTYVAELVSRKEQQIIDRSDNKLIDHQRHLEVTTNNQQQLNYEGDRREIKQLEQQRQPKQLEVGYISTRRGSTVMAVSNPKDNSPTISVKQSEVANNEHNKTSTQHPHSFNEGSTNRRDHSLPLETQKSQVKEINSSDMFSHPRKVDHGTKPSAVLSGKDKANLNLITTLNENHSFSSHSKPNQGFSAGRPGSPATYNVTPKQIFKNSPLITSSQQTQQHNLLNQQDTKLHVTAIKVQNFSMERKPTWPLIPRSDISTQPPEKPAAQVPVSPQPNSLTLTRVTKFPKDISKPDQPSTPFAAPVPSSKTSTSTNPPKSILKNSTSFDHSDLSVSSPHALKFSDEPDSVINPSFDFSKDTISLRKGSSSIFKRQIQSPFMDKITSPPPQRKGLKASESSLPKDEPQRDGIGPKKSVTFDSEVRLHEDDHISIFKTLSVEA